MKGIDKKIAFAGPWIGEFGWEIMTWVPYLRKRSRDYGKMYISTFEGVEALYTGFHCEIEFLCQDKGKRVDNWTEVCWPDPPVPGDVTEAINAIKKYRVDGEYVRYGSPVVRDCSILFHARGIEKGSYKNWSLEKWKVLAKEFPGAMSIGSESDMIPTAKAYTGGDLAALMDLIASASIVIGQSSGVMHLALMCGTPVVTWGKCNNFGDTLENRYKESWNPFHVPVTWIGNTWDPEPEQILDALKPRNVPDLKTLDLIQRAVESGQYMIAIAYMGHKGNQDALYAQAGGTQFPDSWLDKAEKDLIKKVRESISHAKAERIPKSWR